MQPVSLLDVCTKMFFEKKKIQFLSKKEDIVFIFYGRSYYLYIINKR